MSAFGAGVRRLGFRRFRAVLLGGTAVLLLVAAGLGTLLVAPGSYAPGLADTTRTVVVAGDEDGDGLPDAVENRLGSDPDQVATLGAVPDGWLVQWLGEGIDWADADLLNRSALTPPPDTLPEPLRSPGAVAFPTYAELYEHELALRAGDLKGAWWLEHPGLDPLDWDNNDDGVADAWLLQYGLDPLGVEASAPAPGDASMTLLGKYEAGLDPTREDSDNDGLLDREELAGSASLGGKALTFPASDPRKASTAGIGIADGYAALLGLDPHDAAIAARSFLPSGLTVLEGYRATLAHCVKAGSGNCTLRNALAAGPIVDPRVSDANGDGVPEAWAVREPSGLVDPLADARKHVIATSADWDRSPWAPGRAPSGVVVDDANAAPRRPREVTVADLYLYERPVDWSEEKDGPWPFGLPVRLAPEDGALPAAVALRGWNLTVDPTRGNNASEARELEAEQLLTVFASADPRQADGDGDGLTDLEEYFGVRGTQYDEKDLRPRTNAADPDTDGDGLSDKDEDRYGTDPTRQDTAGSFLSDGEKVAYWTERFANATAAFADDFAQASADYGWLAPPGEDPATFLMLLLPAPEDGGGGGDLDGDGLSNVLDDDSDGDGLADGAELRPDEFLGGAQGSIRPPTDPARVDGDGDGLPDGWEVLWSDEPWAAVRPSDCPMPCLRPENGVVIDHFGTWPINPDLPLSWTGLPATIDLDSEVDLTAQSLPVGNQVRHFSNGLALLYDLDPYRVDEDGDGITNLFAIQWGVEGVPEFAADGAPDWARQAANDLKDELARNGFSTETVGDAVAIHPKKTLPQVTSSTNLLGEFTSRAKGAWVYTVDCPSGPRTLPAGGDQGEGAYGHGDDTPAARASLPELPAGRCWTWHAYTLADEVEGRTNPWLHASLVPGEEPIPDAWLHAYGLSADLPTHTEGSEDSGCMAAAGLPPELPGFYCITPAEAYARGLDPTSADTDEGSVPDWEELALGLDPLDPNDDFGQEDWDGDGLPNFVEFGLGTGRTNPDTDGDGLLDGDLNGARYGLDDYALLGDPSPSPVPDPDRADASLGFFAPLNGDGNLCLPLDRDDEIVPKTGHRPGGPLTFGELREDLQARGVVSEPDSPRCPKDGTGERGELFRREAIYLRSRDLAVGDGRTSDSLLRSTAGDGVPDGWKVFWAQRAPSPIIEDALSPDRSGLVGQEHSDPDEDFASTAAEYGLPDGGSLGALPLGWDEDRDGVFWGGSDPGQRDTDGDDDWFQRALDGQDLADTDLDNDGIPDAQDPYPSDHDNVGIVAWDGERYATDFTKLWPELADRTKTSFKDGDADSVPDFLDRARVAVGEVVGPTPATVAKGDPFTLSGKVTLAEPSGGGTGPVAGATVRAVVRNATHEAVVGYAFTNAQGRFTITASLAADIEGPDVPEGGASVAGRYAESGSLVLDGSPALGFKPGELGIRLVVEANDPTLQPLSFAGQPSTTAHKAVPFDLPTGRGSTVKLSSVALSGGTPAATPSIQHSAAGIFSTVSSVLPLTLRDTIVLTAQAKPSQVLRGDTFNVTGSLFDSAQQPLAGETVSLKLKQGAREVALPSAKTDEDGNFERLNVSSDGWLAGPLLVIASVDLGALAGADEAIATVTVLEATSWAPALVQGASCNAARCEDGSKLVAVPGIAPRITSTLLDHRGNPVANRAVSAILTDGEGVARSLGALRTAADGSLTVVLPAFREDSPAETSSLRLTQESVASGVDDPLEFFLEPRFSTRVVVLGGSGQTAPVGTPVEVAVRLERSNGEPVASPDAVFAIQVVPGGVSSVNGTDGNGVVKVVLNETVPGRRAVLVSFLGGDDGTDLRFLRTSAPAYANVTHAFPARLSLDPVAPLRGEPVAVTGTLARWPDGGYPALKPLPSEQSPFVCQVNVGNRRSLDDDAFYLALRPAAPAQGDHLADGDVRLVPPAGFAAGSTIESGDLAEKAQGFASACVPAAFRTVAVAGAPSGELVVLDTGSRDNLTNAPATAAAGFGVADIRVTPGLRPAGTLVAEGDSDLELHGPSAAPPWSLLFHDADASEDYGAGDALFLSAAPADGGPQAPGDVKVAGAAPFGGRVQAGAPVADGAVRLVWEGDNDTTPQTVRTGPDGRFVATLPLREEPGTYTLEARFVGNALHLPDTARVDVAVLPRTRLLLAPPDVTFTPEGAVLEPGPWGQVLSDAGEPLRDVDVGLLLTAPDGRTRTETVRTDREGRFQPEPRPAAFAAPGVWAAQASAGGANASAAFEVVHQVRVVLDHAPAEAAAGEPLTFAGHLDSPLPGLETHLSVSLGPARLGSFMAWTGQRWTASIAMPALGIHAATLKVAGEAGQFIEVLGATTMVAPLNPLDATLEETIREDGVRVVKVRVADSFNRPPPEGLELVLVDGDGDGAAVHTVRLDGEGRGALELPAEGGPARAIAFRNLDARLGSVSTAAVVDHRVVVATDRPDWLPYAAAGAALLAALLLGSWLLWAGAKRRRLREAFVRAHTLLLDGRPARKVIQELYAHVLGALKEAGYTPGEAETVRTIAGKATSAFGLPPEAMYDLTLLCERALYSPHEPTRAERDGAIQAAAIIASSLGVTFTVKPAKGAAA